jgi:hypothetical protein
MEEHGEGDTGFGADGRKTGIGGGGTPGLVLSSFIFKNKWKSSRNGVNFRAT